MTERNRVDEKSLEHEAMAGTLHKFLVKYPDESEIKETIESLRTYVPDKRKESVNLHGQFYSLMKQIMREVSVISKSYWLISALFYVVGYYFASFASMDYLLMLVMVTPIPFVLGLFEIFKGRESGMLELEMTCKFSVYQIMVSRLVLIGLYNIGLSVVLTLIFSTQLMIPIWEIILIWFAPFTIFAAISLWISMRFSHSSFVVMVISCWLIFTTALLLFEPLVELLLSRSIAKQIVLLFLGVVLCYKQVKDLMNAYRSFKGVEKAETSN